MTTNDLILLKHQLKDFVLFLFKIDRFYSICDVGEIVKLIDEIIKEDMEEE